MLFFKYKTNTDMHIVCISLGLFVCFVALRPKSIAMVIAGQFFFFGGGGGVDNTV